MVNYFKLIPMWIEGSTIVADAACTQHMSLVVFSLSKTSGTNYTHHHCSSLDHCYAQTQMFHIIYRKWIHHCVCVKDLPKSCRQSNLFSWVSKPSVFRGNRVSHLDIHVAMYIYIHIHIYIYVEYRQCIYRWRYVYINQKSSWSAFVEMC